MLPMTIVEPQYLDSLLVPGRFLRPHKRVSQTGTQTPDRSQTHHGLASPPRFSPTASVATPTKPSLHLQCTQATEITNTGNLLSTSPSVQKSQRLSSLSRRVVTRGQKRFCYVGSVHAGEEKGRASSATKSRDPLPGAS